MKPVYLFMLFLGIKNVYAQDNLQSYDIPEQKRMSITLKQAIDDPFAKQETLQLIIIDPDLSQKYRKSTAELEDYCKSQNPNSSLYRIIYEVLPEGYYGIKSIVEKNEVENILIALKKEDNHWVRAKVSEAQNDPDIYLANVSGVRYITNFDQYPTKFECIFPQENRKPEADEPVVSKPEVRLPAPETRKVPPPVTPTPTPPPPVAMQATTKLTSQTQAMEHTLSRQHSQLVKEHESVLRLMSNHFSESNKEKISYLVDTSNSTKNSHMNGTQSLQVACKQIIDSIQFLSEENQFNIGFFSDKLRYYPEDGMAYANTQEKANAIKFVKKWCFAEKNRVNKNGLEYFSSALQHCEYYKTNKVIAYTDGDYTDFPSEERNIRNEVNNTNRAYKLWIVPTGVDEGGIFLNMPFIYDLVDEPKGDKVLSWSLLSEQLMQIQKSLKTIDSKLDILERYK